jgi:hypothetical protein
MGPIGSGATSLALCGGEGAVCWFGPALLLCGGWRLNEEDYFGAFALAAWSEVPIGLTASASG